MEDHSASLRLLSPQGSPEMSPKMSQEMSQEMFARTSPLVGQSSASQASPRSQDADAKRTAIRATRTYLLLLLLVAGIILLAFRNEMTAVTGCSQWQEIETHGKKRQSIQKRYEGNKLENIEESISLKLAWLMSFPNSGTSFTLRLIRRASNMSTATNYCEDGFVGAPVYSGDVPGPHLIKEANSHVMPERYILTKTHCGGFCNRCEPSKYIISASKFKEQCATECYELPEQKRKQYDEALVGKAVHLFRNPFDNIVSRYHLDLHEIEHGTIKGVQEGRYSYTPEGFQLFCRDQDLGYMDKKKSMLGKNLMEAAKNVPCHADFYRYVQWHNFALEMLRKMDVPTYTMHYEDYDEKFDTALADLLDFLDMPDMGGRAEYHRGNYSAYYTEKQRTATRVFVKEIASPEIWALLKHYF